MGTVHHEEEATYEADGDFEVPSLVELFGAVRGQGGLPAADGTRWSDGEVAEHRLRAAYYDTSDLQLTAAGVTLRRREGGEDAGWHLEVPVTGGRTGTRVPLEDGPDGVPDRFVTMTYALAGGRPLVTVAQVDTHRTVRRLVDATGRVLVEVADDRVTARRLRGPGGAGDGQGSAGDGHAESTWRAIEVQLVEGPRELLSAVDPLLRGRGLTPASTVSALARTLGDDGVGGGRGKPAGDARTEPKGKKAKREAEKADRRAARARRAATAEDVLVNQLGAQVAQIRANDLPVRLDQPGAVHAMRVASRRLRSTLTTFEPLLHGTVTRPVGRELKRLAAVLGAARDAEVMRDRLGAAVVGETGDAAPPSTVADEIGGQLEDSYRTAHDGVLAALDNDRYRALLDTLDALLQHPPLQDRASGSAVDVLPALVTRTFVDLRTAMTAALDATDVGHREKLLHDARKAAKRARYAAEAVVPVFGADARAFASAMETMQESLGEHLESMNTRRRLRGLAEGAEQPSTAFTYGRLHALEEVRSERSAAQMEAAWTAAKKKRVHRWLT